MASAWAPVAQVGAGMINAAKLLNYTTSLSFNKMELNDTAHFDWRNLSVQYDMRFGTEECEVDNEVQEGE